MDKIRAIIVEDENEGMINMVMKIQKFCPIIEIVAECETGEKAITEIDKLKPDLVFLDVNLGSMTGFDVLNRLRHIHFEVIFTTAYDKYAIDAIKVNAIDYLLKPFKPKELEVAVDKARRQLENLGAVKRISVPISNGLMFIPVSEIRYCLADDNYTKIYREEKDMLLVTKTLKFVAQKLPDGKFLKISRSAIINLDFVESFQRSNGGLVNMRSGGELSISKDRRDEFLRRMSR